MGGGAPKAAVTVRAAGWDPHDFSLSESGYLSQTNVALEGASVSVDLFCRDYGGRCRVYVDLLTTNLPNVTLSFTIPADADNDGIADCWEADQVAAWNVAYSTNEVFRTEFFGKVGGRHELPDPDGPGPLAAHASEGDGTGNFDEYRGVALPSHALQTNAVHRRLCLARKEILVEAHVARGGGTNTAVVANAMHAMAVAEDSFRDTLGIDLLWYVGGLDFEVEVDPESPSNTVAAAADRFDGADCGPPLCRRPRGVIFAGDAFPSDRGIWGWARGMRVAVIPGRNLSAAIDGTARGPSRHFFAYHGIGISDCLAMAATHELGHMVGPDHPDAPRLAVLSEPVFSVRTTPEFAPARTIWVEVGPDPECRELLRFRVGPVPSEVILPKDEFRRTLLGPSDHLTLGQLKAAVEAHGGIEAQVAQGHGDDCAERLLDGAWTVSPQAWTTLRGQAAVNGVMTYNNRVPARFLDPRFSNDPGTTNAVLATLFGWEAGKVTVMQGWGGTP